MTPTIGRIVHYVDAEGITRPAIVVAAGTDGNPLREWVALEVFGGGNTSGDRFQPHVRERITYEERRVWFWPPLVPAPGVASK